MTHELAIAESSFAPVPMTTSILADLRQQAEALDAAHQVAQWLCGTGFAPDAYRGKPKEGAVAILFGARLGLDAVQSLQNVFNVYGTPSTYAKVMKAALLAAGHEVWTVERSATRVVVRGRRRGSDPNLPPEESVWDMERVRRAGYDKRNDKYNKEPENMLYARATAECCRAVAPDVLLGIDVDIEEVRDRGREPIRVESERVPATEIANHNGDTPQVKVQQWQAPEAHANDEAKPDIAPVTDSREPEQPAAEKATKRKPRMVTDEQLQKVKALLQQLGTPQSEMRSRVSELLELPLVIEDVRRLTKVQGDRLIATLTARAAKATPEQVSAVIAAMDGDQIPEGERLNWARTAMRNPDLAALEDLTSEGADEIVTFLTDAQAADTGEQLAVDGNGGEK